MRTVTMLRGYDRIPGGTVLTDIYSERDEWCGAVKLETGFCGWVNIPKEYCSKPKVVVTKPKLIRLPKQEKSKLTFHDIKRAIGLLSNIGKSKEAHEVMRKYGTTDLEDMDVKHYVKLYTELRNILDEDPI